MSHFAEVVNGIVKRVIVADQNFIDSGVLGDPKNWIQTSYNTKRNKHKQGKTPLRGNYASAGFIYDKENDLFLPPKPYDSFVLDKKNAQWVAPIDKPLDSQLYLWNEELQQWDVAVRRN